MAARKKTKQTTTQKQKVLNVFFYFLYLTLWFFIHVGEGTEAVILFPYKITKKVISEFQLIIPQKKSSKYKKQVIHIRQAKFKRATLNSATKLLKFSKKILRRTWRISSKVVVGIVRGVLSFIFFILIRLARLIGKVLKTVFSFIFSLLTIRIRFFFLGFLVCFVIVGGIQIKGFLKELPSPTEIGSVNYPLSTHIYDRNGRLLYEIYRDQNRTPISITNLPQYVSQATIAFEDKDFYRHNGISIYSGILRAAKETLLNKTLEGGSTITQQLVKSALLTPERSLQRKIKEIVLALWTERIYSKKQILQMYLNQVPYGGEAYGIESAAQTYFGKSAKDVTLSEAALLAGLPQSPSVYSPFVNPQLALQRRNAVLTKMEEQRYISYDQLTAAEKEKLTINPPHTLIKAPHFVFHVKSDLENEFGVREVEEGGFKVTTTLDLNLQEAAEKILKEELDKVRNLQVSNGAVLITRPATGEILAMVGSSDYFTAPSGAFNVTTALRQPGSSIKPLMYSLALEKNYTAATIIDDSPTTFKVSNTEVYKPVNYDGKFHGKLPLRYALANSLNIPAVKVLSSIGVDEFVNQARKMGITTWDDSSRFGLSLTLGGGEVKMTDMATAFGVFANAGNKVPVTDIVKLENAKNEDSNAFQPEKAKVLDEGVAYIMSDILSDNTARQMEFGAGSQLEIPGYKVAVKTGTTDSKKDNWTIGYTPNFLVAVWVGNNDGTPMNPVLTSGVTGAAPIWHRVMEYILKNYSSENSGAWFSRPGDVVERSCYGGRTEYFLAGTENQSGCGYGRPTTQPVQNKNVSPQPTQNQPQPTTPPVQENRYNRGRNRR